MITLKNGPGRQVFNVAADSAIEIGELASTIKARFCPELTIVTGAGTTDPRHYVFDGARFAASVGRIDWTPMEEGMRQTLASISRQRNVVAS